MTALLKAYLGQVQARINQQLSALLPQPEGEAIRLHQAMHYSTTLGGKRIRPLLVMATSQAITGTSELASPELSAIDLCACAIECIHAYSLIHDDLPAMDNDSLRRGHPTCHIAFDEATAILAGDALQCQAFELLGQISGIAPVIHVELFRILAQASGAGGMVAGQAIDLAAVNQQRSLDQLRDMHNFKTGALIRASVLLGATVTGQASPEQLLALRHYADAVGLAFQVQDDILDVTGATEQLGKQQGADIALNKPTYVSLLGLEGAREKALALHNEALSCLDDFGPSADILRELSAYIIQRSH